VDISEHAFAVSSYLSFGITDYVEGRLRLGLIDPEGGDMGLIFGGDFKYLLFEHADSAGNPFDMSLGGFLEYADLDKSSILGIGGSVIGSKPFLLKGGRTIEPYSRVNLRIQRTSFEIDSQTGKTKDSNSELEIGLNIGAVFSVINMVDFTTELQLDEEMAFLIGIDIAAF
jgi:hypothetical protein